MRGAGGIVGVYGAVGGNRFGVVGLAGVEVVRARAELPVGIRCLDMVKGGRGREGRARGFDFFEVGVGVALDFGLEVGRVLGGHFRGGGGGVGVGVGG